MSQVTKTIEMLINDYWSDFGSKPAGIVVGPREYLDLCHTCQGMRGFLKDAHVGGSLVTEYSGLPVFVKEMPGIELIIPFQDAMKSPLCK